MAYRDPLAGLKNQIATKRGELVALQRDVPPLLRALLPEELEQPICALTPRAWANVESLEALTDTEAALDALISAYEEARARAEDLRACGERVDDPPAPLNPEPWLIEEPHLVAYRDAVSLVLRRLSSSPLLRWGDSGYVARFPLFDRPFVFFTEARMVDNRPALVPASLVRTTVPLDFPPLEIRRQGARHTLGKALGVTHEIETGMGGFDRDFWIQGHADLRALFTLPVVEALEAMVHLAPHLMVRQGQATLTFGAPWRGSPDDIPLEAAVTVLMRIRDVIAFG